MFLDFKLFQNNRVEEYQPEEKVATKNAVVSEFRGSCFVVSSLEHMKVVKAA